MSKASEWRTQLEARPVWSSPGYEVGAKVCESGACELFSTGNMCLIVPPAHVVELVQWMLDTFGEKP
jgi:hypothetical protein